MCGLNVHALSHAADLICNWGPFWAYSLFSFEDKNGFIARHCHAKNSILRHVMRQQLGSQTLRRQEHQIQLKAEVRVLNICRGRRSLLKVSKVFY